jgi:hypothetical protein
MEDLNLMNDLPVLFSPCDKCGTHVPPENDATIIEANKTGNSVIILMAKPRHFLPVPGICPGSPSRAQYIKGQPRDPRYPYDESEEKAWRQAYAKAQEMKEEG